MLILKITPIAGLKKNNLKQGGKENQMENQDEKEPIQKSCKGPQMVKLKKYI